MKTESTAAEYNRHIASHHVAHCPCTNKLRADVERLKEELASEQNERRAAASALYRAETRLDKAREEIMKLEDEILDCPADSAYHASRSTGTPEESS